MVFVMYYCYEKRAGALQIPHKILFLIYNLRDSDSRYCALSLLISNSK